jgi:hypothetical protein
VKMHKVRLNSGCFEGVRPLEGLPVLVCQLVWFWLTLGDAAVPTMPGSLPQRKQAL